MILNIMKKCNFIAVSSAAMSSVNIFLKLRSASSHSLGLVCVFLSFGHTTMWTWEWGNLHLVHLAQHSQVIPNLRGSIATQIGHSCPHLPANM